MRIVLILVVAALTAAAEYVPGRYIVELEGEPALAASTAKSGRSSQIHTERRAAVRLQQAGIRAALEDRGIQVLFSVELVANALVVSASESQAAALESMPGVRKVDRVRLFKRLLDRAVEIEHVTDAWALLGGMENAGAGVKIAIIDTGIDILHPGFQDSGLTVPDGFPKVTNSADIANTNGKVIVARNYDYQSVSTARDREGHGSGVAMIAAGRTAIGIHGTITGIAPQAYLGNYKVFPDDGNAHEDSVLRAIDDAVADGMDIINLSLGSYPAERPEEDVMVQAIERASAAGVIVTVAAGNEGPDLGSISSPATAPSVITVGNAYTDRIFASVLEVDDGHRYISIPGSGPNGRLAISGPISDVSKLDATGLACNELPPDSLRGQIALILRGSCYFEVKINNAQRAGALAAVVYTTAEDPTAIEMSVGAARLPAAMIGNADGVSLKESLRSGAATKGTVNFTPSAVATDPARVNDGSSRGPSVDFGLKPELLAVGTSVYTALGGSSTAGGGFWAPSGTSFSSPMVAGAAAAVKSARPGLTAQQYKSLLVNSASSFPLGVSTPLPIQQTGAGMLNLAAALKSTAAIVPSVVAFGSTSDTGEIKRTLSLTNVGSSEETYTISVSSMIGSVRPALSSESVTLRPGASHELQVRLAPASGSAGEHSGFLIVRSTAGETEARVPYWFAVPSKIAKSIQVIDADPSAIDLAGSTQIFFVRPTDTAGLPVAAIPTATATYGGGRVLGIRDHGSYPGYYQMNVQLGQMPGDNTFLIEAAGATREVSVRGQ